MPILRLDKFISNNTEYSRSQIKDLIKHNKILVDNISVKKSDIKIDTNKSVVLVDGKKVFLGNSKLMEKIGIKDLCIFCTGKEVPDGKKRNRKTKCRI